MLPIHEAVQQPLPAHLLPDVLRRQMHRLVAQLERAPVDDRQPFRAELLECLDGFPGIDVALGHEPAGFVGAQVDHRQVDVFRNRRRFMATFSMDDRSGQYPSAGVAALNPVE